jgi:hypothetical protein
MPLPKVELIFGFLNHRRYSVHDVRQSPLPPSHYYHIRALCRPERRGKEFPSAYVVDAGEAVETPWHGKLPGPCQFLISSTSQRWQRGSPTRATTVGYDTNHCGIQDYSNMSHWSRIFLTQEQQKPCQTYSGDSLAIPVLRSNYG